MSKVKIGERSRDGMSVTTASVILMVTLFLSNVLGVIRDHFLAQRITTDQLDAYFAAFRLPDLLFNVIILGAITSAFIPVFTELWSTHDRARAWSVTNSFLNIGLLVISSVAALGIIFHPWFTGLLVPDFSQAKQALTTSLGQLLLVGPILFCVSYVMSGILNSLKRFIWYSIAPLLYNLAIIISVYLFADRIGVISAVYGVLIGAFVHMLVQLIDAWLAGYRWQPIVTTYDEGLKKIFRLMLPRSLALGATQLLFFSFTIVGSGLPSGSVAILNLAQNIYTMPLVVFGTSFATAIFPTLAETISLNQPKEFNNYFERAFRAIIFLLLPSTVGMILLRAQIVRLILGSGHFGWPQTILTFQTLALLTLSLLPSGLVALLARTFYAMQDTWKPTIATLIQVAVGVSLAFFLGRSFGILGLAFALSSSVVLQLFLMMFWLRPRLALSTWFFVTPLLRATVASLVMGLVLWWSLGIAANGLQFRFIHIPPLVSTSTGIGLLIQVIVGSISGAIVYLVVSRGLGGDEIDWIINSRVNQRLEPVVAVLRLMVPYLGRRNGHQPRD